MNTRPPDPTSETRLIPLLAGLSTGWAVGVLTGWLLFG